MKLERSSDRWNGCLPNNVSSVFLPILFCRQGFDLVFVWCNAVAFLVERLEASGGTHRTGEFIGGGGRGVKFSQRRCKRGVLSLARNRRGGGVSSSSESESSESDSGIEWGNSEQIVLVSGKGKDADAVVESLTVVLERAFLLFL